MKKTKFAAVMAFIYTALGITELPKGESGELAFSEDQDKTLQEQFGGQYDMAIKAAKDVLAEESGLDAQKKAALDALAGAVGEDPEKTTTETVVTAATEKIKEQEKTIEKLGAQPEADNVMNRIIKGAKTAGVASFLAATTATQLFGMPNAEFSRTAPWNERAYNELTGEKTAAVTDFNDVSTVTKLNADLKEFYTKNPEVLRDLKKNTFGLPAFWPKRFNVVNEITDAVIDVANVTQGRKPDWSPNPEFMIEAEKRKNYPVQIDIEFSGYQLQQFESAWINTLFDFNGSSPYKTSFVAYLVKKIDEQARLEDRISSINGVYVFKPAGIKSKGYFLNRQNGLRYQLWKFRDLDKKIIAFKSKLGQLTVANAYDYFAEYALWLKNDVRTQTGLKIYISQQILNGYNAGYKLANSLNQDYDGNKLNYIDGYSNLQFVVLTDLEGTNAFFMTDENNVEILENVPNEKSIYRFEYLKRNTYIHADYYQAAAFVFAGFKLPANSPFLGQAQFIWMNDAPLFSKDFTVPMYGTVLSTPVSVDFNRIRTDINLLSDVVTVKTSLTAGQIVKIEGNTGQLTNSKIIKKTGGNGGNLDLTADFDPKSGGSLTLVVTADGGLKELKRTTAPDAPSAKAIDFTGTAIDYVNGTEFIYKGTADATLTDILNGQEGAEVKIYGQATNSLTVADVVGKIDVTASYDLDAPEKFIVLKKFDGIWFEISRG
ncbi:hypothetical protein [Chryseobacterium sp. FH1]|uniref:hypothetical protein n=1 Tax=Chryseobacterium sp. FH1 TaxID=1233951 RepID=UPI0004E3E1C2|nr:hypothetical protein [Chryseobacterium sp. FH1]KFC19367.1 hypothetical protein IO90_08670 [Chryseobacterium sp. FH1]